MKKSKLKKELGQSLLEIIFSIGIIALVVTGAVVLIISSIKLKNEGFQRKKAVEMSEIVIEDLIYQKKNQADEFWELDNISGRTLVGFSNFEYSVDYDSSDLSCSNCIKAVVTIDWNSDKSVEVSRFFSREVD